MARNSRRALISTVAVTILIAALASIAWACSPQTRLYGITPAAAPPKTAVVMTGESVTPGTPVEIRWNSSRGPTLGQAVADSAGRFSVVVNIPDAAPDVYYLNAVAGDTGVARVAFEVTAPAASAARATVAAGKGVGDLWNGFAGKGSEAESAVAEAPTESNHGSAAGLALVGIGAAGLVAGLGLASRRRTAAL